VAVGTGGVGFQVDGSSAVGAIHKLNVLPQFLDLLRRQRMDEVLFFQELEKADEVTVFVSASACFAACCERGAAPWRTADTGARPATMAYPAKNARR